MKKQTKFLRLTISCIIFFAGISVLQTAKGQTKAYQPKDTVLYKTIVHMDSVMFDAFNTQNLDVLKTLFADNLEFYHDLGGVSNYQTNINNFKNLFSQHLGLKRELVPGTMEVYPIPNYGAVEMGIHKFTHIENGQQVTGYFKFVHTWQFKDGQWKVSRVVSVGH
jgi:hypothetical protein